MDLRIDELATRAGTTSRTVRAYQARGLLPPPRVEGRTGYYGTEHLRRLELIDELQQRGFSLEAIRQTLEAWASGGDLSQLLGVRHILAAPQTGEAARVYALDELITRFPETAERPGLIDRAVELGLLEPTEDGYRAASPLLVEAGAELARAGVPLDAVYDLVEAVRPSVDAIAERFVGIVADHLVVPLAERREAGEPTARDAREMAGTLAALDRLRPLALEVVRPFLAEALHGAIERAARAHGLAVVSSEDAAPAS